MVVGWTYLALVVERTQALVVWKTCLLDGEEVRGWGWKVHDYADEWAALPDHPPVGSERVHIHWSAVIDMSSQPLQVQAFPVREFS